MSGTPGDSVPWTVEVVTHIPYYEAKDNDIGLQLTVISLQDERQEFQLEPKGEPQPVPRQGVESQLQEKLTGRKDSFVIQLPAGFESAAVLVLDKYVGW
jgi:hypothetical protein